MRPISVSLTVHNLFRFPLAELTHGLPFSVASESIHSEASLNVRNHLFDHLLPTSVIEQKLPAAKHGPEEVFDRLAGLVGWSFGEEFGEVGPLVGGGVAGEAS